MSLVCSLEEEKKTKSMHEQDIAHKKKLEYIDMKISPDWMRSWENNRLKFGKDMDTRYGEIIWCSN